MPCRSMRTPLRITATCCRGHSHRSKSCKAPTLANKELSARTTQPVLVPSKRSTEWAAVGSVPAVLVLTQAWAADAASKAADSLAESMAAEGIVPVDPSNYVPPPVEVGWEIYFGAFAGAFPFAIGLYEFTKRIMIQRRCEVCKGSGLVLAGSRQLEVKCPQCGGFFPWRSWREFLSANARPGNGGVLRFPKGQTSVFYSVPDKPKAEGVATPGESVEQAEADKERSAESARKDSN